MTTNIPDTWVPITGGRVTDTSNKHVFQDPFTSPEHTGGQTHTDLPKTGMYSGDTITIDGEMKIEDMLVICASNKIELTENAVIDGHGNGVAGGAPKYASLSISNPVAIKNTENQTATGAIPAWIDTDITNIDTAPANSTAISNVNKALSDYIDNTDTDSTSDYIDTPDIGSIVPPGMDDDLSNTVKGMQRPPGTPGMFGESDFFKETLNVEGDWLEQVYLLAIADKQVGLTSKPSLRGGRGGEGAIIDNSETVSDESDYHGGNGGAGLVLMSDTVTVHEDAEINLQGETPPNPPEDMGVIPPARGRAGKFGVIAKTYDIQNTDNIQTHAEITPGVTGGVDV